MSEGFTLSLDRDQVERLLGIGVCVSRDEARPTLTGVQLKVEGPTVRAVATDSYRLGIIFATLQPSQAKGSGEVLVKFGQLERALRYFIKDLKEYQYEKAINPDRQRITIKWGGDGRQQVSVTPGWTEFGKLPAKLIDASFPNWKQLVPGAWRASEIGRNPEIKGRLPLMNGSYLGDVQKFMGGVSRFRGMDAMVQISPTKTERTELAPWLFSAHSRETGFEYTYLLMPIRNPDDKV